MKSPAIRRSIGPKPPGRSHRGGSNPLILCQLRPPAYRLSSNDTARLLADPRVRAQGWNRGKFDAALGKLSLPVLHARFSAFVPEARITYFVSNQERESPVIVGIKEGKWLKFELALLNGRDAETSAQLFPCHLVGAMSRYLTIQGERYLEDIDTKPAENIMQALYAKLVEGLSESFRTLSKCELHSHEAAEAMDLIHRAVHEYTWVVIENWYIRRFSSSVTIPDAFFKEGITSFAASFDRTLENTLSALTAGGIVFPPLIVVESAACAAALEYQGFPRLALALRDRTESALNAYIPAFLLKAFPELASAPLALPAQQHHFINQALLTFDEVKKFYLLFIPKITLKPAYHFSQEFA